MNGEELREDKPIVIPHPSGLIATNVQSPDGTRVNEVDGFVFSPTKLIAEIKRREARESARFYHRNGWDNSEPWHGSFDFPPVTPLTMPKAA